MNTKTVTRETKETKVRIELALGANDKPQVDTGLPFFDHMLTAFGAYAGIGWKIHARGDLKHHLMEDVALTLGAAVREILPDTAARYGERTIPMDDALVQAVIDVGGRFYYRGKLPSRLYTHVLRSFADQCKATVHIRVLRGKDRHHITEAAFKALGLALRQAMVDSGAVFSTKGAVKLEVK